MPNRPRRSCGDSSRCRLSMVMLRTTSPPIRGLSAGPLTVRAAAIGLWRRSEGVPMTDLVHPHHPSGAANPGPLPAGRCRWVGRMVATQTSAVTPARGWPTTIHDQIRIAASEISAQRQICPLRATKSRTDVGKKGGRLRNSITIPRTPLRGTSE